MKRALKNLQDDERARQEDDLLRAQLLREGANDAALKKRIQSEDAFCNRCKRLLEEWNEEELQIASLRPLTLPVPNPPGTAPVNPIQRPFM
jgi:hypothetical protein